MDNTDMASYGLCGQYELPENCDAIGRVISQEKGLYTVVTERGETEAEISGKLRYHAKCAADFPAVGDFVAVCFSGDMAVIHSVLERKSLILRKAAGRENKEQAIAANIDTVFICMSQNNDFNVRRLERYLSVVWESGASPVVVLTKADLCENREKLLFEAEKAAVGTDIIMTTQGDEKSKERILSYIGKGKTAAFIGSSGVGKSTLINGLLGEERLMTNGLRNDDKGHHTTTRRELFSLPGGGNVIDTPGMREMGMWDSDDGIDKSFSDIEKLAAHCRFSDCTHENEPGCAVREAVRNGFLDEDRLLSYKKLRAENAYFEDSEAYMVRKKEKFIKIAKINKDRRNQK